MKIYLFSSYIRERVRIVLNHITRGRNPSKSGGSSKRCPTLSTPALSNTYEPNHGEHKNTPTRDLFHSLCPESGARPEQKEAPPPPFPSLPFPSRRAPPSGLENDFIADSHQQRHNEGFVLKRRLCPTIRLQTKIIIKTSRGGVATWSPMTLRLSSGMQRFVSPPARFICRLRLLILTFLLFILFFSSFSSRGPREGNPH